VEEDEEADRGRERSGTPELAEAASLAPAAPPRLVCFTLLLLLLLLLLPTTRVERAPAPALSASRTGTGDLEVVRARLPRLRLRLLRPATSGTDKPVVSLRAPPLREGAGDLEEIRARTARLRPRLRLRRSLGAAAPVPATAVWSDDAEDNDAELFLLPLFSSLSSSVLVLRRREEPDVRRMRGRKPTAYTHPCCAVDCASSL
jgi:hypothetical protein